MPEFHPIRPERIYHKIVDQIRQMLSSGQLKPGQRLPSEREVAEQLKVSRPAVREAFSALEMMGLIEVRPGEGTFMRSADVVTPFALLQAREGDATQAREMMEVRLALESQAAALAAQRASEEDLLRIQRYLALMDDPGRDPGEEAGEDPDERINWEFHMAVVLACHNSLLLRAMFHLRDAMRGAMKAARERLHSIPGMDERLRLEHRLICEAIQARDPQRAREAMIQHIRGSMLNAEL